MKYVSNLDINFWHFDVKIYANLIGLIFYTFWPCLIRKELEPTKLL